MATLILLQCKSTRADKNPDLECMDSYKDPYLETVKDSLRYLIPLLNTVYRNDQQYRSTSNKQLFTENRARQQKLDARNVKIITRVLDNHGWLSREDVGEVGARAINAVMIHAPRGVKIKYYLVMIDALRNGKTDPQSVALFEDKLNLALGRRQHYGSQVITYEGKSTLWPVTDIAGLEARRREIRLLPIDTYIHLFANPDSGLQLYNTRYEQLARSVNLNDSMPVHTDLRQIVDSLATARRGNTGSKSKTKD